MPNTDQYLSSPQAAVILATSPRTIHRLVASKELVPVMVTPGGPHGAFLFHRADVERLAAKRAPAEAAS